MKEEIVNHCLMGFLKGCFIYQMLPKMLIWNLYKVRVVLKKYSFTTLKKVISTFWGNLFMSSFGIICEQAIYGSLRERFFCANEVQLFPHFLYRMNTQKRPVGHSTTHSSIYLLSSYSLLGTEIHTCDMVMNKILSLFPTS